MKILKSLLRVAFVLILTAFAIILLCDSAVENYTDDKTFSLDDLKENPRKISHYDYGLLLGTTPQTRIGNRPNNFFKYRIEATEQLYKAGKIKKILISGDEDSLDGVNETICMRDSLIVRGVPASAIILDGKGFRTYDSIVRANRVFGLKSFIIISQEFHNERAVYLADHIGLDVDDITGYNAKSPRTTWSMITYARVKLFIDLLILNPNRISPAN